jgi:hypothetical protein
MASVEKETKKSRVLVISGTGHLGKHIVAASIVSALATQLLFSSGIPHCLTQHSSKGAASQEFC